MRGGDGSDMGFPEKSLNNIQRCNCAATGTPLWERPRLSGRVPYLPHGALFSWVVSRFKAASLVAALNISRGSLYAQISTKAGDFGGQPVPIFGGGATRFSDPSTV